MLIGAVAGFVIVPEHKPEPPLCLHGIPSCPLPRTPGDTLPHGFSHTVYDALRIATWALLIVGVVLLVVGLIDYARAGTPRSART